MPRCAIAVLTLACSGSIVDDEDQVRRDENEACETVFVWGPFGPVAVLECGDGSTSPVPVEEESEDPYCECYASIDGFYEWTDDAGELWWAPCAELYAGGFGFSRIAGCGNDSCATACAEAEAMAVGSWGLQPGCFVVQESYASCG